MNSNKRYRNRAMFAIVLADNHRILTKHGNTSWTRITTAEGRTNPLMYIGACLLLVIHWEIQ